MREVSVNLAEGKISAAAERMVRDSEGENGQWIRRSERERRVMEEKRQVDQAERTVRAIGEACAAAAERRGKRMSQTERTFSESDRENDQHSCWENGAWPREGETGSEPHEKKRTVSESD
jgi:hypothetical protein